MTDKTTNFNKKIIGIGILSLGLCSCAAPDQITLLEKRVNSLAMENIQIKDDLKSMKGQSIRSDIDDIQKNQAKTDNKLNEINAELLRVSGAIDQISHNYSKDRSRLDRLELAMGGQQPATVTEPDETGAAPVTTEPPKITTADSVKQPDSGMPVDHYKKGIELFKEKKFKEAKTSFDSYSKENPQGKYISNAHFWVGECEYNMGRFEEAILEYQTVIEKYPNSEKTSGALLKQGISFQKLGDNNSAKAVFNKLLKHYPNSPQAAIAKDYLKKM